MIRGDTLRARRARWQRRNKDSRVFALRLRDGSECIYCGVKLIRGTECDERGSDGRLIPPAGWELLTVDHILPLARGGGDHLDNLVLACQRCNSAKGVRSPWDG